MDLFSRIGASVVWNSFIFISLLSTIPFAALLSDLANVSAEFSVSVRDNRKCVICSLKVEKRSRDSMAEALALALLNNE